MARFVSFLMVTLTLMVAIQDAALAWQKEGKEEIPQPEDVKIDVKSGATKLPMTCTYYPSRLGKSAIPIICLHGYEGNRSDYEHLALALQAEGHAVIVPDLRGHGVTTKVTLADGTKEDIDLKKMTGKDFAFMTQDCDAIKSWLLEKNNAGELNLESLVVIGADLTTCVAMNWAVRDWNAPQLIAFKNGQDVKAMVLLTPENDFKGAMPIKGAMAHPVVGHRLPALICVGKDDRAKVADAKRIFDKLERQHGEQSGDKKPEDRDTVYLAVETKLQGTELVNPKYRGLNTVDVIIKFINFRVKSKAEDWTWTAREKP